MRVSSRLMLKRLFSIEDFFEIGERYGIDYHFPQLS
ncbi:AraC family transcriptional regulator, partial [Pectobacterium parmentieri]|nr:AraC family transcriptional regulator [Pectobacterium parmentieri]